MSFQYRDLVITLPTSFEKDFALEACGQVTAPDGCGENTAPIGYAACAQGTAPIGDFHCGPATIPQRFALCTVDTMQPGFCPTLSASVAAAAPVSGLEMLRTELRAALA
ncbi:MAG TPA: hypothetical protein VFN10_04645 [Thermoanaerobaculia bacterium]|nr:hypothetical protein [Thermoanaerobaculia bacterium]